MISKGKMIDIYLNLAENNEPFLADVPLTSVPAIGTEIKLINKTASRVIKTYHVTKHFIILIVDERQLATTKECISVQEVFSEQETTKKACPTPNETLKRLRKFKEEDRKNERLRRDRYRLEKQQNHPFNKRKERNN